MKSKLILAVASALAVVFLSVGMASATKVESSGPSLTGKGECQTDGSFKITWKINNSTDEDYKITESSDPSVVPVGTKILEKTSQTFDQTADGTAAGSFTLKVKGKLDDDSKTLQNTVDLKEPCAQPVPTPPVTVASSTPTAQVQTPPVKVNAGSGGARFAKLGALLGLTGSLAVLSLGVRRLAKNQ